MDYEITCERCLKRYDFPQAHLRERNQNWYYRVVGPFSVPDYGRGSYSALLTLRVLERFSVSRKMTFSTSLELSFDDVRVEVDFVAWWTAERFDTADPPDLIIGEAKSLGRGDLIKPADIAKLRRVARKLPGATVVVSVMRDHFTDSEKELLRPFVQWCRRRGDDGRVAHPVILLTGHELFFDFLVSSTWKALGEPYSAFADYNHTSNLRGFAEATQKIYLGLPPVHEQWEAEWKKRAQKRHKARAV